jgi:hypothetical protein
MAPAFLAASVRAHSYEPPQDKTQAAKVAKKVNKARNPAHEAKEEQEAIRDFQKAATKYANLQARELARLGDQKDVTAQALASAIVANRAKAKPGDIFTRDVQPLFRRLLAEQLKGPDALAARKAVNEGNPTQEEDSVPVVVQVNAPYPTGAPRSTVPASVLLTLPVLPESLHYRFVGRDLLLVDSVAQIIVDFLSVAAPTIGNK